MKAGKHKASARPALDHLIRRLAKIEREAGRLKNLLTFMAK